MKWEEVMEMICEYLKEDAAENAECDARTEAILASPEDQLFAAIDRFTENFSFEVMQFLITDENKDFVRERMIKALALN